MWYVVLVAYIVDGIGSGVCVEFGGVVWASLQEAYRPDSESIRVEIYGINVGFCKVADCKGVVGKVKWHAYSRAEGMAFVLFSKNVHAMISDWTVVFAEGEDRWEQSFTFKKFGIGIVKLQSVEKGAMLIKCVGCVC